MNRTLPLVLMAVLAAPPAAAAAEENSLDLSGMSSLRVGRAVGQALREADRGDRLRIILTDPRAVQETSDTCVTQQGHCRIVQDPGDSAEQAYPFVFLLEKR